jgi:outer membrane protein TolC
VRARVVAAWSLHGRWWCRPRVAALVAAAAIIAGPVPAAAQAPLSLADAQAEARAHAPDIAELDALVRGAGAIAAQARRAFRQNPEVSGSYGSGSPVGRADEQSWTIGVALPVDLSGSRKPRAASAEADVKRAQQQRADGFRALDEHVAQAVADLALQQRFVRRLERVMELQRIAADAAHRQLDVGQGTQLDADSADLDLATARVAVEQARGDLAGARARLARFLGRLNANDVVVADPTEQPSPGAPPDFDALVERDPRVRAAAAEVDAATFEQQMFLRLVRPTPTLGLAYGFQRRDIPTGSFSGTPFANALGASWPDRELTFNVSLPLPFFDRQQEPRARATGRILTAEARLRSTRADVRTELTSAWAAFDAATRALAAVASMPATIDRDVSFVEQAVRAGAFDAVQRTQALRRLVEAGRSADTAIRDFRTARAAWIRRAIGPW